MYRLNIAAFVIDPPTRAALETAMEDISLFRSSLEMHDGGIEAAIAHYADFATPDLVFVQSNAERDGLVRQLERLSPVVSEGTQVIVGGTVDSIDFYRSLMEIGVGQYVLTPLDAGSFLRAVRDVYGADKSAERGRRIAVLGAKGGIGASTVAHNVAWALARRYVRPVSLVDLDLHFGTAGIDFNHEPKFGLRDALNQADRLDEALMERLFTKDDDNLWLLASPPSLAEADLMSAERLEAVLEQVARMSTFVVLDIPHLWSGAIADALLVADEVLVVVEPDLPGLRNAQMLFETLGPARPNGSALRYVLNNVGLNRSTELSAKDFAETLGASAEAVIAWDPGTFRAASCNGQMIGEMRGKAKLAAQFDDLAQRLSGRRSDESARGRGGLLAALLGGKKKIKEKSV